MNSLTFIFQGFCPDFKNTWGTSKKACQHILLKQMSKMSTIYGKLYFFLL